MPDRSRALAAFALGITSVVVACATSPREARETRADYLRYVAFEAPGNEHVLLRWPVEKMPLRIFLPEPPTGLFDEPEALRNAAREGVLAWTDTVRPGLPSFAFVDEAAEADVPIAWAETSPDVTIAHCFYDVHLLQRRFGVAQVLVTARFRNGRQATPDELRQVVTHEMGHALGLGGHSPSPKDVMFRSIDFDAEAPVAIGQRDRETLRLLYARPIGKGVRAARSAD